MLINKLKKWFGIQERKDFSQMTEEERRQRFHKALYDARGFVTYNCNEIGYSKKYLRTHTPEEVEARFQSDIAYLYNLIDELAKKSEDEIS